MSKYISAYDPKIRRRILFLVKNGIAISMLTGYSFKYIIPKLK
jgi:hypothetical protein